MRDKMWLEDDNMSDVSVERIQFQHSAQLMKSLTEAGVLYETVLYTDIIQDRQQSLHHLYASITQFLSDSCWFQHSRRLTTLFNDNW